MNFQQCASFRLKVQMTSTCSNAGLLAKLEREEKLLASQELTTTLRESKIYGDGKEREECKIESRE